jgi:SPP1 family predicted phage head-tail adaptor
MAINQPAGELDRRITLQSPVITRDPDFGSESLTWSTQAEVWARLSERQTAESVQAEQRVMLRSTTLRIRWRAGVLSTWRVLLGTRVLRITGTLELGRREWLDLMCEETSDA